MTTIYQTVKKYIYKTLYMQNVTNPFFSLSLYDYVSPLFMHYYRVQRYYYYHIVESCRLKPNPVRNSQLYIFNRFHFFPIAILPSHRPTSPFNPTKLF